MVKFDNIRWQIIYKRIAASLHSADLTQVGASYRKYTATPGASTRRGDSNSADCRSATDCRMVLFESPSFKTILLEEVKLQSNSQGCIAVVGVICPKPDTIRPVSQPTEIRGQVSFVLA